MLISVLYCSIFDMQCGQWVRVLWEAESSQICPLGRAVAKNLLREWVSLYHFIMWKWCSNKYYWSLNSIPWCDLFLLNHCYLISTRIIRKKNRESLKIFDHLFVEFELWGTDGVILFRAPILGITKQDQVDDNDPSLMFTIPWLAIVAGFDIFPIAPPSPEVDPKKIPEFFLPFRVRFKLNWPFLVFFP